MVGRKYRAIECLKYFNARQPYPVLKFKLVNLAREEYPEELIALLIRALKDVSW